MIWFNKVNEFNLIFLFLLFLINNYFEILFKINLIGDWGLVIGDWGLGIGD